MSYVEVALLILHDILAQVTDGVSAPEDTRYSYEAR